MVWVADHECSVPAEIKTLCGHIAEFDFSSMCGYRCTNCMAIIGSMGMPLQCEQLYEQEEIVRRLKGK
jgi:hypothetical protein